MTGTEKIIRHIEEQAAAQEAQILGEAREDSARVRDEAEQRVAKLLADGYTAAAQYAEAERDKRRHAEEMQLRRAALGARSELIAEILAEAKEKILAEDAGAYFARSRRARRWRISWGRILSAAIFFPGSWKARAARC